MIHRLTWLAHPQFSRCQPEEKQASLGPLYKKPGCRQITRPTAARRRSCKVYAMALYRQIGLDCSWRAGRVRYVHLVCSLVARRCLSPGLTTLRMWHHVVSSCRPSLYERAFSCVSVLGEETGTKQFPEHTKSSGICSCNLEHC